MCGKYSCRARNYRGQRTDVIVCDTGILRAKDFFGQSRLCKTALQASDNKDG